MNLEGQLQGGGHLSVPRWPEAPPLGASCQARSGAPPGPHLRDCGRGHTKVEGHSMRPQYLLPQVA